MIGWGWLIAAFFLGDMMGDHRDGDPVRQLEP